MSRTRFTRAGVTAVLREWFASHPQGVAAQVAAKRAVNEILNGSYDDWDQATEMQAVRAMDQMAAGGELVTVARGDLGPDGRVHSLKQPYYYTKAAYAAAEAAASDREQAQLALAARWSRIHDELERRGIKPVTERGRAVRLGSADWLRLLGLDQD
jgi:hypothetical protein